MAGDLSSLWTLPISLKSQCWAKARGALAGALLFLTVGGGQGCATAGRAHFCGSELPQLEATYDNAVLALTPWLNESRRPASAERDPGTTWSPRDRTYWTDWAETRLRAVQSAMDLADAENRGDLRRELSRLADELVVFHGYSVGGRADKMAASIRKLQTISKRVRSRGCSTSSTARP